MKVTIAAGIFWPEIGGPATYIKGIAQTLVKKGVKVDVVCRSNKGNYKEDKELDYRVIRVKNTFLKPLSYVVYIFKLWRSAKDSDVIYAQGPVSSGWPAMIVNKKLKKKFFVKIVGDYAWEYHQNSGEPYIGANDFQNISKRGKTEKLYKMQSEVCRSADKIIVPSNFLKGIVSKWGVDENKIEVVYNGVDFKMPEIKKDHARLGINISGNLILSIGRLVPWKGFKMLIKIMPKLLELNQFFRLVIVGDGPEREKLEVMVKNFSLDKKVFLVGSKNKEELKQYIGASDIFVLNTGYEGFSHQLLEVMAAGLPIVTTGIGGNKEIMSHGENGIVVEYNDEIDLYEGIKMVWDNEELQKKLIHYGKQTANHFTYEEMINQTLNIILNGKL